MSKLGILVVGGIGYVLGARAGRERYDQIRGLAVKVKDNPTVQARTQQAAEVAKDKAREAAPVVKDKVGSAASSAAQAVRGGSDDASGAPSSGSASGTTDAGLPLEENAYPAAGTETSSQNGPGGH